MSNEQTKGRCGAFDSFETAAELLPDYLLGELPESQAVLVQEALMVSPKLMARFKELKGTGRALEAIPDLKEVNPEPPLTDKIMQAAHKESEKIIHALPPERRLRMEVHRAKRNGDQTASSGSTTRQSSPVSALVLIAAMLFLVLGAYYILSDDKPQPPVTVGSLSIHAGTVEHFFEQAGETWAPAKVGQAVRTGDTFATRDGGTARFDLPKYKATIALGPNSEAAVHEASKKLHWDLQKGEIVVESEPSGKPIVVRVGTTSVLASPGSKVALRFTSATRKCEALVWSGRVEVSAENGKTESYAAPVRLQLVDGTATKETLDEGEMAAMSAPWPASLITDAELAEALGFEAKIVERHRLGPVVEISAKDLKTLEPVWGLGLQRKDGLLHVKEKEEVALTLPLAAPLQLKLRIHENTPTDTAFVCALLDTGTPQVVADLDKDALLQIKEAGTLQTAFRSDSAAEEVVLRVMEEDDQLVSQLITKSGETKKLALSQTGVTPGRVWIKALGPGLTLENISIRGRLSAKWLQSKVLK